MTAEQLKFIFEQFDHIEVFKTFEELSSGHINDTYLLTTQSGKQFILQRINEGVFKDVPGLIANKVSVSKHLQKKLKNLFIMRKE